MVNLRSEGKREGENVCFLVARAAAAVVVAAALLHHHLIVATTQQSIHGSANS